MNQIIPGTFVIINRSDRPCTRLIAVVVSVEEDMVVAEYITTGTHARDCYGPHAGVTPVSEFGVEVNIAGGKVTARVVAESEAVAVYPDGKWRRWQPERTETWDVRRDLSIGVELLQEQKRREAVAR